MIAVSERLRSDRHPPGCMLDIFSGHSRLRLESCRPERFARHLRRLLSIARSSPACVVVRASWRTTRRNSRARSNRVSMGATRSRSGGWWDGPWTWGGESWGRRLSCDTSLRLASTRTGALSCCGGLLPRLASTCRGSVRHSPRRSAPPHQPSTSPPAPFHPLTPPTPSPSNLLEIDTPPPPPDAMAPIHDPFGSSARGAGRTIFRPTKWPFAQSLLAGRAANEQRPLGRTCCSPSDDWL